MTEEAGQAAVIVEDNGKGLPQHGRERLTEPYVTTRAKGTGLGLAIVKKIMEDHLGELVLEDRRAGRCAGDGWSSPATRSARRSIRMRPTSRRN